MDALAELTERAQACDKSRRLASRARDYERAAYWRGGYAAYVQAIRILKETSNTSVQNGSDEVMTDGHSD